MVYSVVKDKVCKLISSEDENNVTMAWTSRCFSRVLLLCQKILLFLTKKEKQTSQKQTHVVVYISQYIYPDLAKIDSFTELICRKKEINLLGNLSSF